jgi:hypothetical protein
MFSAGQPAGVHLLLRLRPPGAPKRFAPEHLLTGHGAPIHGPQAAEAVDLAYRRSARDLPRVVASLPRYSF